jgi:hypothetical protein
MPALLPSKTGITCLGIVLLALVLPAFAADTADEFVVAASDDEEISVTRFPAEGEYLMIWLLPEYGFREAHRALAERMPRPGNKSSPPGIPTAP